MFVVAGEVPTGQSMASTLMVTYTDIPSWIVNKIYNVFLADNMVEYKEMDLRNSAGGNVESKRLGIGKNQNNKIYIWNFGSSQIVNEDRFFRIQFDLLIDMD